MLANPSNVRWTTTQPQLPSRLLSLQPHNLQPTSTRPNTLIIHESRKRIHKDKCIPRRLLCVSWNQWEVCTGSSVWRSEGIQIKQLPWGLKPFFSGGGLLSHYSIFLFSFPSTNHHYLDKLLTVPEKLNYINSTLKILSPSEQHTAANKNLPDFHQATRAWLAAMTV